jgi:hypothetical protein
MPESKPKGYQRKTLDGISEVWYTKSVRRVGAGWLQKVPLVCNKAYKYHSTKKE